MAQRRISVSAALREGETVTPLELFFDLVFVLAITQCTALMAADPSWEGIAQGVLVLGMLWWAWVGYAWLTSVIDPEEGVVRLIFFAAIAGLLVISLCIPEAFGDLGLTFAIGYGVVRFAQNVLLIQAADSGDERDEGLRRSAIGLAISTTIATSLLIGASFLDNGPQLAVWALALGLDMAEPFFFGAAGWKLVAEHFAERHGLIVIIALGESIVAIGVGAGAGVDAGIIAAAIIGAALAAGMWWIYFDVAALVSARRLAAAEAGEEQNKMARDSYSYLHLPMIIGIVLVALGLKKTLGHVEDPLKTQATFALMGGLAFYLLGHVGFRFRQVHTMNWHRFGFAAVLLAAVPLVADLKPDALVTLALVTAALIVVIIWETRGYGDSRTRLRHQLGSVSHNG